MNFLRRVCSWNLCAFCFNTLVLRALPLYSLTETPRNATGRGRGRGLKVVFQFWYKDRFYTSPLCFATQNIGERPKKHLFLRRGGERLLFILLSSEKNEPRSAAAVIGLLACRYGRRRGLRNSLRSNSPRPFPSVFLASSPPDKGGIGDCCFCLYSNPLCFINPSVLRTPPLYFAVQNTP